MHTHHTAHLDIALQNIVTDCKGRYAYIDYEQSRRFGPSIQLHRIEDYRATEIPPEFETQTCVDPFKVDIWALGVLILRASKVGKVYLQRER
jgi:serine/threonine protein kinase